MNCIVCNSNQVKTLRDYKSPFVDKHYTLYTCNACDSRFFNVDQHSIDLEDVYEQYARNNLNRYSTEFKESFYWKNQVTIIRGLCRCPIQSVLDVGCRTGDFLMHWPRDIMRCGVEISALMASVAEKRGLNVIQAPVEEAKFEQKFSVVTCYAIVEHLLDPTRFLENLPRLVEKQGIIVIMVPTWQCLKQKVIYLFGKRWHMYSPPQHLNFVSRKQLDQMMKEEGGFRLVRRTYTSSGMFNPFNKIPLADRAFARFMSLLDDSSYFNRWPFFDHMYSYYLKK